MNINLANGWGVVRTIADLCLKQPEGKYVLLKDPNKVRSALCFLHPPSQHFPHPCNPRGLFRDRVCGALTLPSGPQPVIRLYAVPYDAFEINEDIEEDLVSLHGGSDGGLGGL